MAYARAFLEEKNAKKYPDNQVKLLKEIFRYFILKYVDFVLSIIQHTCMFYI